MKKIAVITKNTTYNKYFGGLEVHTKNIIEALAENYEISVISPQRDLKNNEIQDKNVTYYFLNAQYKTGLFSNLSNENWNQKLKGFFKELNSQKKFDLLISISSAGYPIIHEKEKYPFKILTISHGSAGAEFTSLINEKVSMLTLAKNLPYVIYNIFIKQKGFLMKSDKVICVSDYVRNSLLKETSDKNITKYETIFNGASHELFTKEFDKQGVLKILFAGRVEKSKGIYELIQAVRDLDVVLKIAGDGSIFDEIKEYIREEKLDSKIYLLGKLKYSDLVYQYKEADILVSPSLRVEGFPMSIVEAMGFYLPIITTNIGGNQDAVIDNKNGFLINPSDVKDLKEKINYFNKYPEKIKEFGINSRNYAIQKYSFNVMLDKYLKVINTLIE
jgi:glycosyltransferase involved in cell wall biosynthesis